MSTVERSILRKSLSLEEAAKMAYKEYRNNKELTAFHTLDGEDFYETPVLEKQDEPLP